MYKHAEIKVAFISAYICVFEEGNLLFQLINFKLFCKA
jgi:hypothetical protein